MTETLGQIAHQAFVDALPSSYRFQSWVSVSWDDMHLSQQLAWQRAAVAVATFRASSVKSSDIFNHLAPLNSGSASAGALLSSGEVRV